MAEVAPSLRVVPGAPLPVAASKSQKKKRRTGTKSKTPGSPAEGSVTIPDDPLVAHAANESDVKEDNVAPELAAASEAPTHDDLNSKSSPLVEILQKRMRALNKKISRIASYATTDYEKLNDDQKRSLKTLSSLEAVFKEQEEIRKIIESYEADVARDVMTKRAEMDHLEAQKVRDAISSTQASYVSRTSSILTLLRLRSVLATGDVPHVVLDFDDNEGSVIFTACDALVGEESDLKHTILSGLLSGEGELNGVPFTRLLNIAQSFLNPPREPTPPPTEPEQVEEEALVAPEPVAGIPDSLNVSSSLRFMQASELEAPAFEDNADWVERSDLEPNGASEEQPHFVEDVSIEPVETSTQPIDWAEADEEGGLPSIAILQASFAPSGSATPVVQTIEVNLPSGPLLNGNASPAARTEDDGFTPTSRGGRGRGRGHRGERGGMRGGFRGDRVGFHRGGERGGFRGGNRGGDRAHRGNRADGEWRRGDGENRGRGRGRGRGRTERGGSGQQDSREGA